MLNTLVPLFAISLLVAGCSDEAKRERIGFSQEELIYIEPNSLKTTGAISLVWITRNNKQKDEKGNKSSRENWEVNCDQKKAVVLTRIKYTGANGSGTAYPEESNYQFDIKPNTVGAAICGWIKKTRPTQTNVTEKSYQASPVDKSISAKGSEGEGEHPIDPRVVALKAFLSARTILNAAGPANTLTACGSLA